MSHVLVSVYLCVCVLVIRMCPAKRLNRSRCRWRLTHVGPRNDVLKGVKMGGIHNRLAAGKVWQVGDTVFCQMTLDTCYPHMPIGKVWIFRLLFFIVCVCVCLFVCLFVRSRISPPRINLAASNFARRLSASKAGNLTFWATLLPQKPQNRTNWPAARASGPLGQRAGHATRM